MYSVRNAWLRAPARNCRLRRSAEHRRDGHARRRDQPDERERNEAELPAVPEHHREEDQGERQIEDDRHRRAGQEFADRLDALQARGQRPGRAALEIGRRQREEVLEHARAEHRVDPVAGVEHQILAGPGHRRAEDEEEHERDADDREGALGAVDHDLVDHDLGEDRCREADELQNERREQDVAPHHAMPARARAGTSGNRTARAAPATRHRRRRRRGARGAERLRLEDRFAFAARDSARRLASGLEAQQPLRVGGDEDRHARRRARFRFHERDAGRDRPVESRAADRDRFEPHADRRRRGARATRANAVAGTAARAASRRPAVGGAVRGSRSATGILPRRASFRRCFARALPFVCRLVATIPPPSREWIAASKRWASARSQRPRRWRQNCTHRGSQCSHPASVWPLADARVCRQRARATSRSAHRREWRKSGNGYRVSSTPPQGRRSCVPAAVTFDARRRFTSIARNASQRERTVTLRVPSRIDLWHLPIANARFPSGSVRSTTNLAFASGLHLARAVTEPLAEGRSVSGGRTSNGNEGEARREELRTGHRARASARASHARTEAGRTTLRHARSLPASCAVRCSSSSSPGSSSPPT